MPHTSQPVWDSQKSAIKNPVLLIEGRTRRLVEADEVMTRPDGGRSVFAEPLASQSIRVRVSVGKETRRTVKVFRRLNSPGGIRGESSRMTPGRPTDGDIAASNYGRLLDGFAAGWKRARKLFNSRKTMRHVAGVPEALLAEPHKGSILYFPNEGKITSQGRSGVSVVYQTEDGAWEVRDGSSAPTMITESEAKKLIAEKKATLLRGSDERF